MTDERSTDHDQEPLDDTATRETTTISDPYKVLGDIDDPSNGIGVLGRNTASSGTTKGVEGRVDSASGYGLYTPDDASVGGTLEATTVDTEGSDFTVEAGPSSADDAENIVLGHAINGVTDGVVGGVIGGGGGIGVDASLPNTVTDNYGTVGGGKGNQAGDDTSGTTSADHATVGGGFNNTASGGSATVSGGSTNTASDSLATVGGGLSNTASSARATVSGGSANTASGAYATVPGGSFNTASGLYSFAAGRNAKAKHEGSFVWGDATDADFASTGDDQFLIRAKGGVGLGTASPEAPLEVRSENNWNLDNNEGDLKVGDNGYRFTLGVATGGVGAGTVNIRAKGGDKRLRLGSGGSDIVTVQEPDGVYPRADDAYTLGRSGNRWTEVWATNGTIQTSDARLKENVADLEDGLGRMRELRPVSYEWADDADTDNADTDDDRTTHLGLLAQEVREVVPEAVVAPDDGYLGVNYQTLVPLLIDAIRDLDTERETQAERVAELEGQLDRVRDERDRKDERITELEAEIEALCDRFDELEGQVATLTSDASAPASADD